MARAGVIVRGMCDEPGQAAATDAARSAPRAAEGPAVDPVSLPAVDEITVDGGYVNRLMNLVPRPVFE